MHEYSEDNIGARALNWVMIGGAAALFLLASLSSVAPVSGAQEPQRTTAIVSVPAQHSSSVAS